MLVPPPRTGWRRIARAAPLALGIPIASGLNAQPVRDTRGDIDRDGSVTSLDALAALWSAVGKPLPPAMRPLPNGDGNGDGTVSATDALAILNYTVGRTVPEYPVGTPIPVVTPIRLAPGAGYTCALDAAGQANCWGFNDYGQLGTGSTTQETRPARVATESRFAAISTGGAQSCALTAAGQAYCWGWNYEGHLRFGPLLGDTTPVRVGGGLFFESISVGHEHTCALTAAGQAYCWGHTGYGALGNGPSTVVAELAPVAVRGGHVFSSISAGGRHTCALTAAGQAYCWGRNFEGQLGYGPTAEARTPVATAAELRFASISAGQDHTCALTPAGQAYCWGSNSGGQVDSGSGAWSIPAPTPVPGGHVFTSLGSGYSHACGLTVGGEAFCWGWNQHGQGGSGSTTFKIAPTAVSGGLNFAFIDGGDAHTCAATLAGQVYCWGNNGAGALGDGSTTLRTIPVAVSGMVIQPDLHPRE